MEMIYFLTFIGVCAIGIIWFVVKSHRSGHKQRNETRRPTYHLHKPGLRPVLHNHSTHPEARGSDIWSTRRQHAAEERRGSYSLTARKINFDGEESEIDEVEEVSMRAFKYTPTDMMKRSGTKR